MDKDVFVSNGGPSDSEIVSWSSLVSRLCSSMVKKLTHDEKKC